MVALLVWLCCAVGCYLLSKEKNRNQVTWAVLGFVFGVFALIVLLVLPKKDIESVTVPGKDTDGDL